MPHLIDFETPSDEAICLHEAGDASAALVVGLIRTGYGFLTLPMSPPGRVSSTWPL